MAQAEDGIINQGETKVLTFRFRDSNLDPWDLSGKIVRARFLVDGVITTKNCVAIGSPLIGKATLTLEDIVTVNLAAGAFPVDVAIGTTFGSAEGSDWVTGTDTIEKIFKNNTGYTVEALYNGTIT